MKKRLIAIILLVIVMFNQLPLDVIATMANEMNTTSTKVQDKNNFENPFVDVQSGSWYYDAVQYAIINNFFTGTSTKTFEPNAPMNRGMFVTVLGRMAGVDHTQYMGQSTFSDVKSNDYYAPYVEWASKHGITVGEGNGKFNPEGLINREQMAVFFVRYFEKFGVDYGTSISIKTIPADLNTISPWAQEMVLKLWKTGLLAGDGVRFNPTGKASRAEAATLCMRTDDAVETWYKEPGVPSDRVSIKPIIEPKPEVPDSSGGSSGGGKVPDSSGGGNSGGGSNTTYYKVTFVIDGTSEEQLHKKDILLSTMPIPAQSSGKVFLGWYSDIERSNPIAGDDKLTGNITLYAKFADTVGLDEGGTLNYVSALDQKSSFSIQVESNSEPKLGEDFKFKNITDPDKTPEGKVSEEDEINAEGVQVKDEGNRIWTISSANGGFTEGHTYQIELISDDVIYDDSLEAFGNIKENNALYDINKVRFFNFSIEKDGTLNLKLNNGIKYIKVDDLNPADGASLMEYAGLYLATTDSQGVTTYTANNGSGSFTYTGVEDIQVGDTVSIYDGTKPTERQPEKGNGKTNNDDVSYVKITGVDGNNYSYVAAEADEVLFTPDVLPIDVDVDDGTTGWTQDGSSVSIETDILNFDTGYEDMGLNADTTVDIGDYMAFYSGDFGDADAIDKAYGEISKIDVEGDKTIINYEIVEESEVMSAMDLYDETQLSEDEIDEFIEQNKDEIEGIIESQLMNTNFFDDAGEYLAEIALQTDEVKEVFGDNMTMSDCVITYADGTPIGSDDLALMGNIIDNEQDGRKPKVSVSITPRLSHFSQNLSGTGMRVEVSVNYNFKIQKAGNKNVMEVNLTAFFEQELTMGFSVSGGAVWKKKWIFPYIADYRMNGNLDLGTYTGIGITATAKLTEDDEAWGMPWPSSTAEANANKKIFSLSESIRKSMEEVETILPEAEVDASGGLAEKYAAFMEDANEEWVDLIKVNLINLRGGIDPFHILAYGLQVDFVVSANLNVAIGMTFQYENFKRHSFTLSVKSKQADSKTVDLSTNGYQFDFYVMGTMGIRAGIRAKATVGLFSTKIAGVGLQIEAGAYARMWGYFYYSLENWKKEGVWEKDSSYSGALLIEIGSYLDVKFIAEALNGKYSYAPTLYANEWALWSAGQRENVYDFAYEDDPTYDILNVNTYKIPSMLYDMLWMDLKSGDMDEENKKNFDSNVALSDDDEKHFAVEMSNPNFSYNPENNEVTIKNTSGEVTQTSDMKITWKGAPLSGSSEVISRTITLNWSNEANAATIAFDSRGGSAVEMIRLLNGTSISSKMPLNPTKLGYTFAGWYMDENLNNLFTSTTMQAGNTNLFAKWVPNNAKYTVEHYKQALDGQYLLEETDNTFIGTVDSQTIAIAKNYEGFTNKNIANKMIMGDGSTRVEIYYDRNSYDLKFDYGSGNVVTVTMPYGSAIVKPLNPSKQGYVFKGWDNNIPNIMMTENQTFNAKWTLATDTLYMVKHIKQNLDGTYPTSGESVVTEALTGTTNEYTNAKAKTYTGFTNQNIENKTISADGTTVVEIKYPRNTHILTWESNGGEILDEDYTRGETKYGTIIDIPEVPTRKGYSFQGWYKDVEFNEILESGATMPDIAITLYAKWIEASNTYTVKHIKQNVDGTYPTTGDLIETETLNGATGKETNAEAKTYKGFTAQEIQQKTIAADGSTVIEIQYPRNTHILTWESNGGEILDEDYTRGETKYGTIIDIPEVPTRKGYSFQGWYKDVEFNEILESGATMPDIAITLYAKWIEAGNTYTVKHIKQNVDGTYPTTGDLIETETLNGATGKESNAEAKTYKGFTAQEIQQKTIAEDGSTVIEIQYSRNSYTISFNGNGNTSGTMENQTFVYGDTRVLNANGFTKEGYTFKGWLLYTDDGNILYTNEELLENLDLSDTYISLYAQWEGDGYIDNEVWVNGVKVIPENANDILGDNGSVSYDASTKTLTLNKANLKEAYSETITSGEDTIVIDADTLTLNLIGDNYITGVDATGSSYGIRCDNLTIEGDGSLTVVSGKGQYDESSAIVIDKSLTINSGTLNVRGIFSGLYMFRGSALTINGGTVIAQSDKKAISGYSIELNENSTVKVGDNESSATIWNGTTPLSTYKYFSFEENK